MLAANQGQKRSRGEPLRSLSAMTLMPFCSTPAGPATGGTAGDAALVSDTPA